jgi:hypothetical protein
LILAASRLDGAARLEDLDYGYIDGIEAAVRRYPWKASRRPRSNGNSATSSSRQREATRANHHNQTPAA